MKKVLILLALILAAWGLYVYSTWRVAPNPYATNASQQTESTTFGQTETPSCLTIERTNCAYLTGFEKNSDGSWNLHFSMVWFPDMAPFTPVETQTSKTLTATKDTIVLLDFDKITENFSSYQSRLIKKDGHYVNPTVQQSDSFLHNGLYELDINGNTVTRLKEGGDFSRAQGT